MRKTCLDMVHQLAKEDEKIVFIGSDLGAGTLSEMQKEMPERFFMEGVTEANIIGMAAGLAMDGFLPYVNTISTFITRRCYEQVAIDLCLHNLPVKLIGNGGGLVYAPLGPTHLAIEDIAIRYEKTNRKIKLRHLSKDCHKLLTNAGQLIVDSDNDPEYGIAVDYNVKLGVISG